MNKENDVTYLTNLINELNQWEIAFLISFINIYFRSNHKFKEDN